jgi:hypothetical protein
MVVTRGTNKEGDGGRDCAAPVRRSLLQNGIGPKLYIDPRTSHWRISDFTKMTVGLRLGEIK